MKPEFIINLLISKLFQPVTKARHSGMDAGMMVPVEVPC
jgi:hypothetical protein